MRKKGYVKIGELYTVHIQMLKRYDTKYRPSHYRLSKRSCVEVLLKLPSFHPNSQIQLETEAWIVPETITNITGSKGTSLRQSGHIGQDQTILEIIEKATAGNGLPAPNFNSYIFVTGVANSGLITSASITVSSLIASSLFSSDAITVSLVTSNYITTSLIDPRFAALLWWRTSSTSP